MKKVPVVLRAAVALLILIAVAAVFARASNIAYLLTADEPSPLELTPTDENTLRQLAAAYGIEPGSQAYDDIFVDVAAFNRNFTSHPIIAFTHLIASLLFVLLAPLQFSRVIRSRYLVFHRWSGRFLLVTVAAIGLSALYYGLLMPFGGRAESIAIATFGGLFLFAGTRAFIAIRARDISRHREWMIRMFAIAIGVSSARIADLIIVLILGGRVRESFGPALWIGWIVTLGIAELWIRHTRVRGARPLSGDRPAQASLVASQMQLYAASGKQ